MKKEKFDFCIARPWHPENKDSSLCVYTLHNSSVFHGDIDEAISYKDLVIKKENGDKLYSIYKLEKVDEPKAKQNNEN